MVDKPAIAENGTEPLVLAESVEVAPAAPVATEPAHPPDYPVIDMGDVSWYEGTEMIEVGEKLRAAFNAEKDSEDGASAAVVLRKGILEYLTITAPFVKSVPAAWLTRSAKVPDEWTADTLARSIRTAYMQWLVSDISKAISEVPND